MSNGIVQLKKAQKVYQLGTIEVPALIDIDLDIHEGDFAVVRVRRAAARRPF